MTTTGGFITTVNSTFIIIITRDIGILTTIFRATIVFSTSILIITDNFSIFTSRIGMTNFSSTFIVIVAIYRGISTSTIRITVVFCTFIFVITPQRRIRYTFFLYRNWKLNIYLYWYLLQEYGHIQHRLHNNHQYKHHYHYSLRG